MKKLIGLMMTMGILLLSGTAWAASVSETQARTVAENFIAKDSVGMSVLSGRSVDAVAQRGSLWLVMLKPGGYLLVGGKRLAEPIYAFSASDFVEPSADSPQKGMLDRLEKLADESAGSANEARWRRLLGEKSLLTASSAALASDSTATVNIEPLVKSNWGQTYPFNGLSPVIKKAHTPVGCVATAYDQIMRYWEWPEVLDADITTEHTVDNAWGLKWQLLAGTDFEWASSPLDATTFDNPTSLRMSRQAIFAGMIAKMDYNTQSGTQTGQPGINRWYTPYTSLDSSNSTLEKRKAAMIDSLQQGCPFMVSVTYGGSGHAVVGDGWKTSDDGTSWVHMNYGWQSTSSTTYYTPSSAEGVYLYQKPRPMVLNRPIRTRSALPVALAWAFPTKGYEKSLKDFAISYTAVSDTETDWSDDLSNPKGTRDGELITTGAVGSWDGGDVLKIGTQADEAYYTWPTVVATAATKLTYDVHSNNARGMLVRVQLFDPASGWTTIDTPEISENGESDWTKRTVDLAAYEGKGIAVRVYATRSGSSYVVSDAAGVHIDNVTLARVREAARTALGETVVAGSLRAASISDAKLTAGQTYLFTVTPRFSDTTEGIPGYAQSCTIADDGVARPTITSVSSVTSNAPEFGADGMQRNAYLGLNQIGVYGTAAMTDLTAELNVKSLVDWGLEEDVAVPGTYITAARAVSIADAVTVEKKSDGNFLVRVDVSGLSESVLTTKMILTLRGYNSVGDICQKDICLYFDKVGDETRIDIRDLPENGGTVEIPEPEEPDPEAETDPEETEEDPEETAEETPVVTPTFPVADGAGPNDDASAMTRFCPGVGNASSGVYDVTRTVGGSNYLIPAGHNLVYWWIDRFAAARGAAPEDYVEPDTPGNSDAGYTIQSYTYELLDKALATTLPAGAARRRYFPTAMLDVTAWQDGATTDGDKLIAIGRHIYTALAQGPIGIRVETSTSRTYGAVIWGCAYATDEAGAYATALYVTDTALNTRSDVAIVRALKTVTNNSYETGVGLEKFNNGSTPNGLIKALYPISGPEPASSDADEVTVRVSAGGREFDITKAFSKVAKGADGAVTYTLDDTPGRKVEVGGEQISIQPELADGDDETPFEVRDGKLVFTVKSIPGLKYQVLASDSLDPDSFEPAGEAREATGTRRELSVTQSGEARGFYKVQVSR